MEHREVGIPIVKTVGIIAYKNYGMSPRMKIYRTSTYSSRMKRILLPDLDEEARLPKLKRNRFLAYWLVKLCRRCGQPLIRVSRFSGQKLNDAYRLTRNGYKGKLPRREGLPGGRGIGVHTEYFCEECGEDLETPRRKPRNPASSTKTTLQVQPQRPR